MKAPLPLFLLPCFLFSDMSSIEEIKKQLAKRILKNDQSLESHGALMSLKEIIDNNWGANLYPEFFVSDYSSVSTFHYSSNSPNPEKSIFCHE